MHKILWSRPNEKDAAKTEASPEAGNVLTIKSTNAMDAASSRFGYMNQWILCTDIIITDDHVMSINEVDGVEAVGVVSKYRLDIIIGNAFDEDEVKKSIESVLLLRKETLKGSFTGMVYMKHLDILFDNWQVLETETGIICIAATEDSEWYDNLAYSIDAACKDLDKSKLTIS